jgi:hypothetical protein
MLLNPQAADCRIPGGKTVIRDLPLVVPENATLRETEALFGLPPATLRRLVASGEIRAVRVYQRTLIDLASLRAYLARLPSEGGSRPRAEAAA